MKYSISNIYNKFSYNSKIIAAAGITIIVGTGLSTLWTSAITPKDDSVVYKQKVKSDAAGSAAGLTLALTPLALLLMADRRKEDEIDAMNVRIFQQKVNDILERNI